MACVGKGTYTTFFPDQGGGASAIRSTYSGQWKDGRRHGSGEELAPDGSGYSGAWKNGKMHGKGVMHGIADRFVVKGKWERGEPNKLTRAALLSITPQPSDDVDRDAEAILGATTMTVGGVTVAASTTPLPMARLVLKANRNRQKQPQPQPQPLPQQQQQQQQQEQHQEPTLKERPMSMVDTSATEVSHNNTSGDLALVSPLGLAGESGNSKALHQPRRTQSEPLPAVPTTTLPPAYPPSALSPPEVPPPPVPSRLSSAHSSVYSEHKLGNAFGMGGADDEPGAEHEYASVEALVTPTAAAAPLAGALPTTTTAQMHLEYDSVNARNVGTDSDSDDDLAYGDPDDSHDAAASTTAATTDNDYMVPTPLYNVLGDLQPGLDSSNSNSIDHDYAVPRELDGVSAQFGNGGAEGVTGGDFTSGGYAVPNIIHQQQYSTLPAVDSASSANASNTKAGVQTKVAIAGSTFEEDGNPFLDL